MIPEVPPDLAAKALQADVRNTLESVAHGDQLQPGKRQLFLDAVMTDAAPKEILEARWTALLRKFATGGRLRKEELEEIAHLLPGKEDEEIATPRRPHETGYLHPYKHYESIYGKKQRTIQWWIAQGEASNPPKKPPLDRPRDMPVWWGEVMTQRCPPSVLAAAAKDIGSSSARTYEAEIVTDQSPASSSTPPRLPAKSNGSASTSESVADFEVALLNVQMQRDRAHRLLIEEQEKEEPDQGRLLALKKDWRELDDAASKKEAQVIELRAEMGRYVDKNDIAAELGPMLNAVSLSIRVMWRRIKTKMLAAQDESEEDSIWQDALDDIYGELERGGYLEPFSLSSS